MHDDVPPTTGVPTLVHGDLKPANMLWRDGELVSLLDWEMSFNGDPAWDLGYMLIFLPGDLHPQIPGNCDLCGMWGGDQLIAVWEEGTGRSVAHCLWFEAASHAKVASLIAYGYHVASVLIRSTRGVSSSRTAGRRIERARDLLGRRSLASA